MRGNGGACVGCDGSRDLPVRRRRIRNEVDETGAYTLVTGGLRVREDIAIVETPRREDSRRDIVLTVLINRAFPLLRYQTGDLTESAATEPAASLP